jgi:hypothetical protein
MRRLDAIGLIASLISEKATDRNVSLGDLCAVVYPLSSAALNGFS